MIAVDSSSLIAYLNGETALDTELVDRALQDGSMALPPVVLTEALSFPELPKAVGDLIRGTAMLEVQEGYWERAGAFRAALLESRLKARLADTLIATSCIDHGTMLITRDPDFRHFAQFGLRTAGIPK